MLEKYALVHAMQVLTAVPSKSFSVRGLAREAKLSPGASRIALDYMHKKGMVSLKVIGKTYQYKASLDNALCRQWKTLFNVNELNDSKIVNEIIKRIPLVQSILLYGSLAKGTNDMKSDVDLLVISLKKTKTDLRFVNKIKKEVNVTVFSWNEWRKKAVKDKVFYENVIFDSIVLFGERPVVL
ncbi:MAG: nucleotidyltransferase domain-containing protein [archaeon]